jgi:shikimate dehydrogenase
MSSAIKCFGLAGMPVSQSKSPALFHAAYQGKYAFTLLPAATASDAMRLFREHGLSGMNVTMPLKELMLPFVTTSDEGATLLRAVNTVVLSQGTLRGYNTDVHGAAGALAEADVPLSGRRCVVLGAGGAGRAAACALAQAGAALTIANRTVDRAEAAAKLFHAASCSLAEALQHSGEYDVIVNTLPAAADIAAQLLYPKSWQVVMDADYMNKPLQTVCRNAGAKYIDGSRWLLHQAIPAYRLFTGEEPDVAAMALALFS